MNSFLSRVARMTDRYNCANALACEIQEIDCDPDRVWFEDVRGVWSYEEEVKNRGKKKTKKTKTKKKKKKRKKVVITMKDLLDNNVSDKKMTKYLKYLESIQFTDGDFFIEFIKSVKKKINNGTYQDLINNDLNAGVYSKKEHKQVCLFFEIFEKVFRTDQLVNEELYQYWMAISKFCHFPFAKLISIIESVEQKNDQASNADVKHHISLFCDHMSASTIVNGTLEKMYM